MNLIELIKSRRTIHSFSSKPVPEEWIAEALDAAIWAPNHKLTFPWRFKVMDLETRERIADLAVRLKGEKEPLSTEKQAAVRQSFLQPSHLIALGLKRSGDALREREDYASVAAGVQNASLVLWARGVGSKWTTGPATRHPETYRLLGADPEQIELVGFFWVGFPERIPPAPARPPSPSFF